MQDPRSTAFCSARDLVLMRLSEHKVAPEESFTKPLKAGFGGAKRMKRRGHYHRGE
jgi:hypothetical protein